MSHSFHSSSSSSRLSNSQGQGQGQAQQQEESHIRSWSSTSSSSLRYSNNNNLYDELAAKDLAQSKQQQPTNIRMLLFPSNTTTNNNNKKKKTQKTLVIRTTHDDTHHHQQQQQQHNRTKAKTQLSSSSRQKQHDDYQRSKKYQFQRLTSGVSIKTVDLTLRTAFEERALLHLLLTGIPTASSSTEISPSPLHVQVLNHSYVKMKEARQLCWHPSVSMDANPFLLVRTTSSSSKKHSSGGGGGGGGYRGISNEEYRRGTLDLMTAAPILTYYKTRLPMRADVGFPDARDEEILTKQEEIRIETEWEEFSPRLIQLLHTPLLHSNPTFSTQEYHWISSILPSSSSSSNHYHPLYPYATPTLQQCLSLTTTNNTHHNTHAHTNISSRTTTTATGTGTSTVKRLSTVTEDEDDYTSTSHASETTAQIANTTTTNTNTTNPNNRTKQTPSSFVHHHRSSFSVFAPPVDATYSTKHMWRARPFADRPAGMTHVLVTPILHPQQQQQDNNPVVCSFALYYLNSNHKQLVKLSEDCNIASTIPHTQNNNALKAQFPQWKGTSVKHHQKKAILSYDPILTPTKDLYILFQLYQVTQPPPPKTKKSFRWSSSKTNTHNNNNNNNNNTKKNSNNNNNNIKSSMYQTFGTQYLSPFCFGFVPLYSPSNNNNNTATIPNYPKESCQQSMNFLPYPSSPNVDFFSYCYNLISKTPNNPTNVTTNTTTNKNNHTKSTSSGKKKSSLRRITSSKEKQQPTLTTVNENDILTTTSTTTTTTISFGYATVVTSSLGIDFTQSLLHDTPSSEGSGGLRSLVDPSGDCAIAIHPDHNANKTVKKRSNLIRLPPVSPCGYLESAEITEVLSLPHPEWTLSSHTLVNFLYLYPKKILFSDGNSNHSKLPYTVRIRLVQQSMEVDESTGAIETVYTPMESIYNPAPGSPSLLTALYTKIPFQREEEVKVRLPLRLDGSYFFQFTLYTLHVDEKEQLLQPNMVNETLVPLSTTTRSNHKVMTIIPNGLHRIKLVDNVIFQIETKLASTLHVSDTSVATVLRDFPFTSTMDEKIQPKALTTNKFSTLLSDASCEAIVHHFYSLINMNMYKLLQPSADNFEKSFPIIIMDEFASNTDLPKNSKWNIMLETIQCIFVILTKTKTQFLQNTTIAASTSQDENANRLNRFMKQFIDIFDEQTLCPSSTKSITANKSDDENDNENNSTSHQIMEEFDNYTPDVDKELESISELALEKMEEKLIENAVLISVQQAVYGKSKNKYNSSSMTRSNTPFVRKAYGVSKTDRMRAEAERLAEQKFTEMFDDDETVATASTWQSHSRWSVASMDYSARHRTFDDFPQSPGASTIFTAPSMKKSSTTSIHTPFERAKSMAKRVNNLVIAPCVVPSFSQNIFPSASLFTKSLKEIQPKHKTTSNSDLNNNHKNNHRSIVNPGSDVEEEEYTKFKSQIETLSRDFTPYPNAPVGSRLRGHLPTYLDEVPFTIQDSTESPAMKESSSPYLYETILLLWSFVCRHTSQRKLILPQFIQHMDFILPVCLKSFILRCSTIRNESDIIPSMVLDGKHMHILSTLSKIIPQGLYELASVPTDDGLKSDKALLEALALSEPYLDFLIGLFTIIHPSQVSHLVQHYFDTLESLIDNTNPWSIRCSCQLRIRAVEKLAAMPRFIAINFPPKYESFYKKNNDSPATTYENFFQLKDNINRLPETHWLANLLANNCFRICSICSERALLTKQDMKGKSTRQNLVLSQEDKIRLQATAVHAITCLYELLLRRHAIDDRHQTEEARGRIAGMYLQSILINSVRSVAWLTKLDITHKIRTTWLLSLLYIIQEAPENALREKAFIMSQKQDNGDENSIHSLLLLLKLAGSTFQSLINLEETRSSIVPNNLSPWLVQESFNTICAGAILIVDECADMSDKNNLASGVFDLLLFVISTPQSSVTLLRCLGGTSHALEKFGAVIFLEVVGDQLQNWARVIFTLMNSTSLSVRSMAVDLTISLFGGAFEEYGNIDYIALVFLTVLPEIVAREIAMYSASGCISSVDCVESALWPLRRALADIEDASPIDDDRVDSQLAPFLSSLCRDCQAIIDGVLIELRLRGQNCKILGVHVNMVPGGNSNDNTETKKIPLSWKFDADEESLYEAANFFQPETGPMQRIRWLLTLKSLHELKGQWVEAAETLILCAKCIADAIPHIKNVWRPSRFDLWYNQRSSPWLSSIGRKKGDENNNITNSQVMDFADGFLEPHNIRTFTELSSSKKDGDLYQPSVAVLCKMLTAMAKEALAKYDIESGLDKLIFSRLERLLRNVMSFLDHGQLTMESKYPQNIISLKNSRSNQAQMAEEIAALRKMSATINELVTIVSERMLLLAEEEVSPSNERFYGNILRRNESKLNSGNMDKDNKIKVDDQFYVRLLLMGEKPTRFEESTTIPTFLEWGNPVICRVPKEIVSRAFESCQSKLKETSNGNNNFDVSIEKEICDSYAKPYLAALNEDNYDSKTILCYDVPSQEDLDEENGTTFFVVTLVHMKETFFPQNISPSRIDGDHVEYDIFESKCFVYGKKVANGEVFSVPSWTEMTVARKFPSSLSRQKTLITSEYITGF